MSSQLPQVLKALDETRDQALERLFELIRIPSVSTDPAYKAHCRKAAEWCTAQLQEIGFDARVVSTTGHPMVVGQHRNGARQGTPHVLFYGHYDVQPPDPLEKWQSPPFQPQVRNHRLYARGVSDDKGPMLIPIKTAEAFLKTVGKLPINLKLVIEGEEERGSAHLGDFVAGLGQPLLPRRQLVGQLVERLLSLLHLLVGPLLGPLLE